VSFHQLGQKVIFQVNREIVELEDGGVEPWPELLRGLPAKDFTPIKFFGDWPNSAWVQVCDDNATSAYGDRNPLTSVLYRWEKDRFRRIKPSVEGERYDAWFPGDGSVGALACSFSDDVSADCTVKPLDGASKAPVPRLTRGSEGEQRLFVRGFLSLPSGHLFVLSIEPATALNVQAVVNTHVPRVERFGPGEQTGKLETLPLPPHPFPQIAWSGIAARSPDDVYVIGVISDGPPYAHDVVSFLDRFDGKEWKRLDVPQGLWAPQIAVGSDGTLWVLSDTPAYNPILPDTFQYQLLRRSPSGEWAQVRLRTQSGPFGPFGDNVIWSRLFVRGNALWLASFQEDEREQDGPTSLWTTGPVDAALRISP
jgi:hypothetical protein